MTFTRGQLVGEVYDILSKSATSSGLLTPTKVYNALQDSLDYISTKMMKIGGAWLTNIAYASVSSQSPYCALPPGLAIINFVKFKPYNGSSYVPIPFHENAEGTTDTLSSGVQGALPMWRISGGMMYLEPQIQADLPNAIMIDGVFYPQTLKSDGQLIEGDLDNRAFIHYAKFRTASMLRTLSTKEPAPWQQFELEWKQAAFEIIARRFRQPTPSLSFC